MVKEVDPVVYLISLCQLSGFYVWAFIYESNKICGVNWVDACESKLLGIPCPYGGADWGDAENLKITKIMKLLIMWNRLTSTSGGAGGGTHCTIRSQCLQIGFGFCCFFLLMNTFSHWTLVDNYLNTVYISYYHFFQSIIKHTTVIYYWVLVKLSTIYILFFLLCTISKQSITVEEISL